MKHVAGAFVWQLVTRIGEESFAQGLFPTEREKLRRSETTLGARVVFGDLIVVGTAAVAATAALFWVITGRGPGERFFAFRAGSPLFGPVLMARVRAARESWLLDERRPRMTSE